MLCPLLTGPLSCSQADPGDLETTGQSPLKLVIHCEDSRGHLEPVCPCGVGMELYSLLCTVSHERRHQDGRRCRVANLGSLT